MTAAEEGVLLLCSRLGDSESRPLTMPQFRELGQRVRLSDRTGDPFRVLSRKDLTALGYDTEQAERILRLLDRKDRLHRYLRRGEELGIHPLTRISAGYPERILRLQGNSCPPVLFYCGDLTLLERASVAVIGSRQLRPENEAFARRAGRLAAEEGLVLVSGGAVGADQTAQAACLDAGGSCIVFAADELARHGEQERLLCIGADGYDVPFSAPRALLRNHLIHMQGDRVLAAQCTCGSGGTWQGCLENLKHGWSPVFVYDDGSDGAKALTERGASPVHTLNRIGDLQSQQISMF